MSGSTTAGGEPCRLTLAYGLFSSGSFPAGHAGEDTANQTPVQCVMALLSYDAIHGVGGSSGRAGAYSV